MEDEQQHQLLKLSLPHAAIGVSRPVKLPSSEFQESIKLKIIEGLNANPKYSLLLEKLADPSHRENVEYIKSELREIKKNEYNPQVIEYLEWLEENSSYVAPEPGNLKLDENLLRRKIKKALEDYYFLFSLDRGELNAEFIKIQSEKIAKSTTDREVRDYFEWLSNNSYLLEIGFRDFNDQLKYFSSVRYFSPEKDRIFNLFYIFIEIYISKKLSLNHVDSASLSIVPSPAPVLLTSAATVGKYIQERRPSPNNIQRELPRVFGPPLSIERSYIHLAIIPPVDDPERDEKKVELKATKKKFLQDERLNSFEKLFDEKLEIDISDLFKSDKNNQNLVSMPRFILVEGSAGSGKTTFASYIYNEWSRNKLFQEFSWVFKITLNHLTQSASYQKKYSDYQIRDIVFYECYYPEMSRKKFNNLWENEIEKSSPEKVLFILDGYDEITSITNTRSHPLLPALNHIIHGECYVILTSRPYGLNNLPVDRRRDVEVIGFTRHNIFRYIQQFFLDTLKNKHEASSLTQELTWLLKANPSLWSGAHIPIVLNMVCGIFVDRLKNIAHINMTILYQQIEEKLLERAYQQIDNHLLEYSYEQVVTLPEKGKKTLLQTYFAILLNWLEEAAIVGLKQETLLITKETLDDILIKVIPPSQLIGKSNQLWQFNQSVGLLKPVDDDPLNHNTRYEFIHLTFQEYFAARWIVKQLIQPANSTPHEAVKTFIGQYKFNPRYQIVWWFVAGLLRESPIVYQHYLELLQASPKDLTNTYSLCLLMRCLDEGSIENLPNLLWQPIVDQIRQCLEIEVTKNPSRWKGGMNSHLWMYLESSPNFIKIPYFFEPLQQAFIKNLKNDDTLTRQAAANALGQLKQSGAAVIEALMEAVEDKEWLVRHASVGALGRLKMVIPEVIDALVGALNDEKWFVRQAAGNALVRLIQHNSKVNIELTEMLEHKETKIRQVAANMLGQLRRVSPEVINELIKALNDEEDEISKAAAKVLVQLGRERPEVTDALIKVLENKNKLDQYSFRTVIEVLTQLKQENPLVTEVFISVFKDKGSYLLARQAVAEALAALEHAIPNEVIDVLLEGLEDSSWLIIKSAMDALIQLAPKKPHLFNILVDIVKDDFKPDYLRYASATVLAQFGQGKSPVIEMLMKALENGKWPGCYVIVDTLGKMKKPTDQILNGLVKALDNFSIREAALNALVGLKKSVPQINDTLKKLLKDKDKNVRKSTIAALRQQIDNESLNITFLIQLFYDEDLEVRQAAINAAGELKQPTIEIVELLTKALEDNNVSIRQTAVVALGKLREATPEVIEALLKRFQDENSQVCKLAIKALRQLVNLEWLKPLLANQALTLKTKTVMLYALMLKQIAENTVITLVPLSDSCFGLSTGEGKILSPISLDFIQAQWIEFVAPRMVEAVQNYDLTPPFDVWLSDYEAFLKEPSLVTANKEKIKKIFSDYLIKLKTTGQLVFTRNGKKLEFSYTPQADQINKINITGLLEGLMKQLHKLPEWQEPENEDFLVNILSITFKTTIQAKKFLTALKKNYLIEQSVSSHEKSSASQEDVLRNLSLFTSTQKGKTMFEQATEITQKESEEIEISGSLTLPSNIHSVEAYLGELQPRWIEEFDRLVKANETQALIDYARAHSDDKEKIEWLMLYTASEGNIHQVDVLLQNSAVNFISPTRKKPTVMHMAALQGDMELLEYAKKRGFGFTAPAEFGPYSNILPIHCAIVAGDGPLVLKLMKEDIPSPIRYDFGKELGASRRQKANGGFLELGWLALAVYAGQLGIVKILLNEYANNSTLLEKITYIRGRKGNILHLTVQSFQQEILEELLSYKIVKDKYLEEIDENGFTPFGLAARLANIGAMKGLKRREAMIDEPVRGKSFNDYRPLHLAIEAGGEEGRKAVAWLIQWGVDVSTVCQKLIMDKTTGQEKIKDFTAHQLAKNCVKVAGEKADKAKTFESKSLYARKSQAFSAIENDLQDFLKTKGMKKFKETTAEKVTYRNLIFKGGGPKGMVYVGALVELLKKWEGHPELKNLASIERVGGTSAGAITAALLAVGYDPHTMHQLSLEPENHPSKFLEGRSLNLLSSDSAFQKTLEAAKDIGWYALHPLHLGSLFGKLAFEESLCSGDVFLEWIEGHIRKATGKAWCTFGELKEFIDAQPQRKYRHLHVVTIQVSPKTQIKVLSSENPYYKNYTIAHAIRASMSVPVLFKPAQLYELKIDETGHRKAVAVDINSYHIDGGVLANYPLKIFDEAGYVYQGLHLFSDKYSERFPVYNEATLGFYIKPGKPTEKAVYKEGSGKISMWQAVRTLYESAEDRIHEFEQSGRRSIPIGNAGITLYDFNLTQKQLENLFTAGQAGVDASPLVTVSKVNELLESPERTRVKNPPKGALGSQRAKMHGTAQPSQTTPMEEEDPVLETTPGIEKKT